MEYAKNEREYIEKYKAQGYSDSYRVQQDVLINLDSKKEYNANDITVVAEHRFEGMSNPSDMSILYVIEANNETKGTVLANYSPSSDTSVLEFFNSIPEENYVME